MVRALRLGVLLALVLALIPAPAGAADLDVQFTVVREGPTSVTIRATISGATGPIQAAARVEPLGFDTWTDAAAPQVRGLRVDAVERVSEYRHIAQEETKRIPIAEAMTALETEITALRETKGLKSEEIDARREERHGKEIELEALRSQADHGATFIETTSVVAHEYRLETRERLALVAHCNAGDSITLPAQSWAEPPPPTLLSESELSLDATTVNWGESTAVYEWTISTGELQRFDGSWGSSGVLVVNINGSDYYDTENSSWWDSSWPYRMKLAIDNSASTENLSDFPMMVKLTPERFDYSFAQVDGDDIRFVDPDGTALDYECDTWELDGDSFFWVRVPQVDAGSTTDYFWMYYGTAAVGNGENAEAVWNDGYVAVYHMNDKPGDATKILDSTANANHGTKGAGATAPTEVAGTVGRAQQFVASQIIYLPDVAVLKPASWTVAALLEGYADNAGNAQQLFGWGIIPGIHAEWDKGRPLFYMAPGNNRYFSSDVTAVLEDGEAHTLIATMPGNGQNDILASALYLDGVAAAVYSTTATAAQYGKSQPRIGNRPLDDRGLNAALSELRLSSVARSGEWIEAEYLTMWDSMLTYGDTEGYEPEPDAAPILPLTESLLIVSVGAAAVWRKHLILYVAAFVLYLFSGLTLADESLMLGIPVMLYAGYFLFAVTTAVWRR